MPKARGPATKAMVATQESGDSVVFMFSELLPAALVALASGGNLKTSDMSCTIVQLVVPVEVGGRILSPVEALNWMSVWGLASSVSENEMAQATLAILQAKVETTPGPDEDLREFAVRRRRALQRSAMAMCSV